MNWLKSLVALAVLAVWLPASNHCRLEVLPLLEFLACCPHEESAPHEDADCETDGCETVENGFYKTEDAPHAPAAPEQTHLADALPAVVAPAEFPATVLAGPAPPELSRVWQFSFRAAAPPRAPSLAS